MNVQFIYQSLITLILTQSCPGPLMAHVGTMWPVVSTHAPSGYMASRLGLTCIWLAGSTGSVAIWCDCMASGEDMAYIQPGRSAGRGMCKLAAPIQADKSWGARHWQHAADLQDELSGLRGCDPRTTSVSDGRTELLTSTWKLLSPVPVDMTDISILIFLYLVATNPRRII